MIHATQPGEATDRARLKQKTLGAAMDGTYDLSARQAATQLPHAPLMKVLGLPAETNPRLLGRLLRAVRDSNAENVSALIEQSVLMRLLSLESSQQSFAEVVTRLARGPGAETMIDALLR
jgi:hypothetical protein